MTMQCRMLPLRVLGQSHAHSRCPTSTANHHMFQCARHRHRQAKDNNDNENKLNLDNNKIRISEDTTIRKHMPIQPTIIPNQDAKRSPERTMPQTSISLLVKQNVPAGRSCRVDIWNERHHRAVQQQLRETLGWPMAALLIIHT